MKNCKTDVSMIHVSLSILSLPVFLIIQFPTRNFSPAKDVNSERRMATVLCQGLTGG